mgnify:CR=1 FL=1
MKIQAIYTITNIITNKIYVGSAIFLQSRWRQHKSDLNLNKHGNPLLQHAWNKYGKTAFEFKILERVEDKTKLIEREQYWINKLNSSDKQVGYNLRVTAISQLGMKRSKETKLKISIAKTGRKQSPEEIERRRFANTGKKRSLETRARISAANKGRKLTDSHKRKLSEAHKKPLKLTEPPTIIF